MEKKTLVLGVIGADVHAVGVSILNRAFLDAGFDVVNLGVMVSQEEFISAAIETGADAIMVSSLYGQGELDCRGLREKCDEAGLKGILLYVGVSFLTNAFPLVEDALNMWSELFSDESKGVSKVLLAIPAAVMYCGALRLAAHKPRVRVRAALAGGTHRRLRPGAARRLTPPNQQTIHKIPGHPYEVRGFFLFLLEGKAGLLKSTCFSVFLKKHVPE